MTSPSDPTVTFTPLSPLVSADIPDRIEEILATVPEELALKLPQIDAPPSADPVILLRLSLDETKQFLDSLVQIVYLSTVSERKVVSDDLVSRLKFALFVTGYSYQDGFMVPPDHYLDRQYSAVVPNGLVYDPKTEENITPAEMMKRAGSRVTRTGGGGGGA